MSKHTSQVTLITKRMVRGWPLPEPQEGADKEGRGCVLIVAGAPEMPGAAILAATAALRAGAGKLQIATCQSIASIVAAEVPEARVFRLPETAQGGFKPNAADLIAERANQAQAVLIGPGMMDEEATAILMKQLLPCLNKVPMVLDATALTSSSEVLKALGSFSNEAVLTPHAGEMAKLIGEEKATIQRDPLAIARRVAAQFHAVVTLKGAATYISASNGDAYCNKSGDVGLATSGSGDTLSGIIAGLLARGASSLQAAVWGVALHARAGEKLSKRHGGIGFLARELLAEVPALMAELAS